MHLRHLRECIISRQEYDSFADAINGLFQASHRLENLFPGRLFTPDGHMVGSIGEAAAQAHYAVILEKASAEAIDGWVGSKSVQIKATTGREVSFMVEGREKLRPDHLLVFHISESGEIGEIYNGSYGLVLEQLPKNSQRNGQRQISISKLMGLDTLVPPNERIQQAKGRTVWPYRTPVAFRKELIQKARAFATTNRFHFYESLENDKVVVFEVDESSNTRRHGNFIDSSYQKILSNGEWINRLNKSHTQRRFLPDKKRDFARELDSCTSSDALLMNIFCHPETAMNPALAKLLGFRALPQPRFGYDPGLLKGGRKERNPTEIDMVLSDETCTLLCEAKLTEPNFQTHALVDVEKYDLFESTFSTELLPVGRNGGLQGFQLIRNIMAAGATGARFCLIHDARRGDLVEQWYRILSCVLDDQLKNRCSRLTWQQIAACCPVPLQEFLKEKYGIEQSKNDMC